jgi:hypothetical protein
MIYNSFGFALVSSESLLYAVYVIIWTPARLSSLQQTIQHYLLATLKMQDKGKFNFLSHYFLPSWQVLNVSGKAIDQKTTSL